MDSGKESRTKRIATYQYHALRIVLFVAACALAVAGMLMLTVTSEKQMRAETVAAEAVRGEAQANVLLILSYSDSDPLVPLERAGVVNLMNASSVAVDVEYMDATRNPKGSAGYEAWSALMERKISENNPYNVVICADDEALAFVEDHHDDVFANLPVVFFGVNDVDHARSAALSGYATGLVEQGYVSQTVELARQLRPDAAKCLVVVDDTPSGKGDRAQFEGAAAAGGPASDLQIEYVCASDLTRDELTGRLGAADDGTIVFLLDAFVDASGNAYARDEAARFVASSCGQPVFGVATGGVGEGLLCSAFTDPEKDGQRAAEMAIRVLNGTSPGNMELEAEGSGGFVFDSDVLGKFGIPVSAVPADAALINEPALTWDSVRGMMLPVGLILLGVVCILLFALLGYRHSIHDTREIIAQRNDLQRRFYHDQLTEKPNMQWLNDLMGDPARAGKVKSVVAVDFADFGDINDSYGRAAGDAVITEFAERFEGLGKEFLVRSTGAEFIIGFGHEVADGGDDLRRIGDLLGKPVEFEGGEIDVDAHIGIANQADGQTLRDLVSGVDLAVRESKRDGAGLKPVFYDARMKGDMEDKIRITTLLKQSIKDESFVVLYQPQVDSGTNEVCGYEALVRMKGNAYYPNQFIPVAEMSGLVIDVDRIVTKKVVQQLATWRKRHKRVAPVSINYSAVQFKDDGYVDFLLGLLEEHDVSPSLLKIEITESVFMDDRNRAEALFDRLRGAGISLALDDFGTGYTSLARVTEIPASTVKIDKSLVDAYAAPGKGDTLDNLVRLIHGMGKTVVVEGVETAEQLDLCRQIGCDIVQGFYFSQPLLPEAASQYKPAC